MAFSGGPPRPPLHKDAITATTERTDDAEELADSITRFPTYHLEPFQLQRAQALQRAIAMLPDAMIEEQIKAAHFIETGHIPDA